MPVHRLIFIGLCATVWFGFPLTGRGQSDAVSRHSPEATSKRARLALVDSVVVRSELAQSFVDPLSCDRDGNLYLKTDVDSQSGIRKLNPKGERLALFVANSAADLQVQVAGSFSVAADGDVYQLAYLRNSIDRSVLVYSKDGRYKSGIKLEPGFAWVPSQVASFSSGNLLVTGLRYDPDPDVHTTWPFTGVFSSDGTLRKQVLLEDDVNIHDMAASGDRRVVAPEIPSTNKAVELGEMEAAADGNVYLMRRLSPAIVYGVSPGGEVVKRFTVDPSDTAYMPISMHISRKKMAILFREPQTREELVKIVDLEGRSVATYDEPMVNGRGTLGSAFACYLDNPERFIFLYTANDEGNLGFRIAEPR